MCGGSNEAQTTNSETPVRTSSLTLSNLICIMLSILPKFECGKQGSILEVGHKESPEPTKSRLCTHLKLCLHFHTQSPYIIVQRRNISSPIASMSHVARLPPIRHSRHRFSLAEFELSPLQDPRDALELAFPCNTSYGRSLFSTSDCETRNLIDKSADGEGIHFLEGGRRAWLVAFGSWCGLVSSLGLMNTMGAFQEYISTHQLKDADVAITGWIFSLHAFMTFVIRLFVGPLFDKYGPRWLILSGNVLVFLSMNLIGNCIGR
jgi:hypothetical protein